MFVTSSARVFLVLQQTGTIHYHVAMMAYYMLVISTLYFRIGVHRGKKPTNLVLYNVIHTYIYPETAETAL